MSLLRHDRLLNHLEIVSKTYDFLSLDWYSSNCSCQSLGCEITPESCYCLYLLICLDIV